MNGADWRIGSVIAEAGLPSTLRILEAAGFDHVIVDCEHGAFGFREVEAMVGVMHADSFDVYVRTATTDRTAVLRYLDMGCAGIVAPMVETEAAARTLVEQVKYRPVGRRGVSTFRAHTGFRPATIAVHQAAANDGVRAFAQIESVAAVARVETILRTEGLDGVLLGPNDLLDDLGDPGNHENPALLAAFDRLADAGRLTGKITGVITSRPQLVQRARASGMSMLTWSSDSALLFAAAQQAALTHGGSRVSG